MEQFTANAASITVRSPAGGVLTYRDAWTLGWEATIDGVPVAVGRNGDGFKTLAVPPGNHRVELVFRPLVGERSLLVLAVFLALSIAAQVSLAWPSPRNPHEPSG